MTIGIIVAMNADRIIGVNGSIPWKYSADMKRFKSVTMGSTVIMGRKTWESIPAKFRPLAGRNNMIITSNVMSYNRSRESAYTTIKEALSDASSFQDVWFIGGARIYAEAMQYADVIDVTWVPWTLDEVPLTTDPEDVSIREVVHMPDINETVFTPGPREPHPDDPALALQRFTRIKPQV